jgi:hypothetical protein
MQGQHATHFLQWKETNAFSAGEPATQTLLSHNMQFFHLHLVARCEQKAPASLTFLSLQATRWPHSANKIKSTLFADT